MARSWMDVAEALAASALNDAVHLIERQFPEVLIAGDPASRHVAVTYDDGPHPVDTPALLAVLRRHNVTATFSWLGERVELYPELVAEVASAGHQLMIHGYRHRSFLIEEAEALKGMLDRTRELLTRHSGRDPAAIDCVRPPYGHLSRSLARNLIAWGYNPVICSIMPVHWMAPEFLAIRHVLSQAEGGSLIVLHESLAGPPVAELTDKILTGLAEKGFGFVTVDTLRAERAAMGGASTSAK